MISIFLVKARAKEMLRGNWQTALLVTFFSGLFVTLAQVLQNLTLSDVQRVMSSLYAALEELSGRENPSLVQQEEIVDLYRRLMVAVGGITPQTQLFLTGACLVAMVVSPVLSLCRNHYFLRLNAGEEIGVWEGLTARLPIWRRALWLQVVMTVRIFLWGLLLVVPGIIAAIRYSMAPYYLAENPELTASQAIEKSKESMAGRKMAYFMLLISFVWWALMVTVAEVLVTDLLGTVAALVAAQFLSLALQTYVNGSCAVFYGVVSRPDGMDALMRGAQKRMREMGMEFPQQMDQDDGDDDESDE